MIQVTAKSLELEHLSDGYSTIEDFRGQMKKLPFHAIDNINWPDTALEGLAQFKIAYNQHFLALHFNVKEPTALAQYTENNSPVYEDSCVEFFIETSVGCYYNFEFNCIGTVLAEKGSGRNGRSKLSIEQLETVITHPSLGRQTFEETNGPIHWSLDCLIPLELIDRQSSLQGTQLRGNFYKCADRSSHPHYLSWNRIETEKPDFHRPEFFGLLNFI